MCSLVVITVKDNAVVFTGSFCGHSVLIKAAFYLAYCIIFCLLFVVLFILELQCPVTVEKPFQRLFCTADV